MLPLVPISLASCVICCVGVLAVYLLQTHECAFLKHATSIQMCLQAAIHRTEDELISCNSHSSLWKSFPQAQKPLIVGENWLTTGNVQQCRSTCWLTISIHWSNFTGERKIRS